MPRPCIPAAIGVPPYMPEPPVVAGAAPIDVPPPEAATGATARAVLADSPLAPAVQVAGTDNPPSDPARPATASTSEAAPPIPASPGPVALVKVDAVPHRTCPDS